MNLKNNINIKDFQRISIEKNENNHPNGRHGKTHEAAYPYSS